MANNLWIRRGAIVAAALIAGAAAAWAAPALGLWSAEKPSQHTVIGRGQAGVGMWQAGPALISPTADLAGFVLASDGHPRAVGPQRVDLYPAFEQSLLTAAKKAGPGGRGVIAIPLAIDLYADGNVGASYTLAFDALTGTVLREAAINAVQVSDPGQCTIATADAQASQTGLVVTDPGITPSTVEARADAPPSLTHTWCLTASYQLPVSRGKATIIGADSETGAWHRGSAEWSVAVAPPQPAAPGPGDVIGRLVLTPTLGRPTPSTP
jgi:hypothetical protein